VTDSVDNVAAGRAAWARPRDRDRATWSDWLDVARALAVGRVETMKAANTHSPVGSTYNRLMGAWLKQHGFADINNQERYRALRCLENLDAIEAWRAGLADAERRKLNHPNAIWQHWRRQKQEPSRSAPAQHFVKSAMPSHRNGRPVHWPQSFLRRGAEAYRECRSNDVFIIVRLVLERTIRNDGDLLELLAETKPQKHQAKAPAATAAVHAA
jgi:hypothetical protein